MSADCEVIRLAPLGGLSGLRVADEGSIDGQRPLPMRGGFNVQVVDGEWWCRPGYTFPPSGTHTNFGSVPWFGVVTNGDGTFLWHPAYALRYSPSQGKVAEAYAAYSTGVSITFTTSSNSATTAATPAIGDMILADGAVNSLTTNCYLVKDFSGGTITLDRASEINGAHTCRLVERLSTATTFYSQDSFKDAHSNYVWGSCVLIDQLVTHAGNALYSGSPSVTAGETYMIICSAEGAPVAFRTDAVVVPLRSWFRDTSTASPTAITGGYACAIQKNRLIIGYGTDPSGNYGERTIWWSSPGDFLVYHTGVAGQTGVPFYKTFDTFKDVDPILTIEPIGESLVVHRRYSQEVGTPNPSAAAPYRWTRRSLGAGLVAPRAIATVDEVQYLMTDRGLSRFDGANLVPVLPAMREHAKSMQFWQQARAILHDPDQLLLYVLQDGNVSSSDLTRHQAASVPTYDNSWSPMNAALWTNARPVMVYDYQNNACWFEDHISIVGGGSVGNALYVSRPDGSILALRDDNSSGKDASQTSGTHTVDAIVDTPWIGFEQRARLNKIVVGFRALDLTTGGSPSITDLWTLTTETLHLATVSVFAEGDMTTAVESQDYTKLVSAMKALTADENQQMPVMDIEMPFDQAAGMSLKLRIKNALSAASTAAGYTKGLFRIAYIDLHVTKPLGTDQSFIAGVPDPAP